jgi:hypothetical protein
VSKDRARPFSRKHRKYWIPVTGGMIFIGIINVALGFCSYTPPSDVHERIVFDSKTGSASTIAAQPMQPATGCAPAIRARVEAQMPGATLVACAPDRVTVMRGSQKVELEIAGDQIRSVAEILAPPDIPAVVMRAFVVAYPKIIPSGAIKRTRPGVEPVYEVAFPPGGTHTVATLRGDGTLVELR